MRVALFFAIALVACTVTDWTFHSGIDGGTDGVGSSGCSTIWYADLDGDGHGDPAMGTAACVQPALTSPTNDDCNDHNAKVHPGVAEICDSLDNDCSANTLELCPPGCQPRKRPGFEIKTYLLCSTKMPWASARTTCLDAGFHLTQIDDVGENTWLRSAATATFGAISFHIGATDIGGEGVWRWDASGDQFWQGGPSGVVVAGRYSNWTTGEPNNADDNEDCAEMGNGTWNDTDCLSRPFACERSEL